MRPQSESNRRASALRAEPLNRSGIRPWCVLSLPRARARWRSPVALAGHARCVPSDGFEPPASTFGTSRSAPLSYEGLGTSASGGIRTPSAKRNRVTAGPNSPTLARSRVLASGCLTGFEPVLPESQSGALPLSYSHHRYFRAYPRRDLNPQPSVCRTVALPLSYTGMCGTYPGLELNQRPPSYQDGALPLSYQDGSEGWPRCLCSRLRYVCSRLSLASARRYAAKGSNFRPRIKSPVLNHSASGAGTQVSRRVKESNPHA